MEKIEILYDDKSFDIIDSFEDALKSFGIRVVDVTEPDDERVTLHLVNERTDEEVKEAQDKASEESKKTAEAYKKIRIENERRIEETIRESDR